MKAQEGKPISTWTAGGGMVKGRVRVGFLLDEEERTMRPPKGSKEGVISHGGDYEMRSCPHRSVL